MHKVLITGSSGFVGNHLKARLEKDGLYEIIPMDYSMGHDTANPMIWKEMPDSDVVVHLAAKSFIPDSWNDIAGYINCNVHGTIEALNYCKDRGAKFIFFSSYMYGNPEILPIKETAPVKVNNPYALSKKMAEDVCKFYYDSFQIPVIIFRPFNIYGAGQGENFLIPFLMKQIKEGTEVRVKDLEPKRDYVYIEDLINAVMKAIVYKEDKFNILNIGNGISYSVGTVISLLSKEIGKELPVLSENERRLGEIMDTVADITKAKEVLGWEPSYGFEEGLKHMLGKLSYV